MGIYAYASKSIFNRYLLIIYIIFLDINQDYNLSKSLILDKLHINEGMFAENYIFQALISNGNKLFYYENRGNVSNKTIMEIDFLTKQNKKITPLEVKSVNKITTKSLKKFKDTFTDRVNNVVVLYDGDIKVIDDILYLLKISHFDTLYTKRI